MVKITFDPSVDSDVAWVENILGAAPVAAVESAAPTAGIAPEPAPADDAALPELDSLGMPHNPDYHQTPPKLTQKGAWTGKRGKKDELDAAIKAHQAASVVPNAPAAQPMQPAPATPTMPAVAAPTVPTMPATPAPNTPVEPIDFEQMVNRFTAMIDGGKILDYAAVYTGLPFDPTEAQTNETMRRKLWHYMDALDAGHDHATAINHVTANAG